MKDKIIKKVNNRLGNKKVSLLLVLRALEQMSDASNPIKQIHLSKMVNDIGGLLNLSVWCDRKTVGRHIKLLKAAGYNIIDVKGKGCYLKSNKFTKTESEFLESTIKYSFLPDAIKKSLIDKLNAQQENLSKEDFKNLIK